MNFRGLFGFERDKIIDCACLTRGRVLTIKKFPWVKEFTQSVRLNGKIATLPLLISFVYEVEGVTYKGTSWASGYHLCPDIGETLEVFYDADKPEEYAVHL